MLRIYLISIFALTLNSPPLLTAQPRESVSNPSKSSSSSASRKNDLFENTPKQPTSDKIIKDKNRNESNSLSSKPKTKGKLERIFSLWPLAVSFILGLLASMAIFLLGGWNRGARKSNHIHTSQPNSKGKDWEISKLEGQLNRLQSDKVNLESENTRLRKDLETQISLHSNKPASLEDITLSTTPESTPQSAPEPEQRLYAPAAEDAFIEVNKVYGTPSAAAALMLIIDPKNKSRAEFEFSPYADQAHIINTSISQLDQFFAYTLPSRAYSKISTEKRGSLRLENGRWIREKKAELSLQ